MSLVVMALGDRPFEWNNDFMLIDGWHVLSINHLRKKYDYTIILNLGKYIPIARLAAEEDEAKMKLS